MDFKIISIVLFLLLKCCKITSFDCPHGRTYFRDDTDGSEYCLVCQEGYTKVANCTFKHDTVCATCTDDKFYDQESSKCKTCTVCDAGYYVKTNCNMAKDTQCEVCPNGTFSSAQNSNICLKCTKCKGTQLNIRNCRKTEDTICIRKYERNEEMWISILQNIIIAVLVISIVIYITRRRRYCPIKTKDSTDKTHGETVTLQENENLIEEPVITIEQENENLLEESVVNIHHGKSVAKHGEEDNQSDTKLKSSDNTLEPSTIATYVKDLEVKVEDEMKGVVTSVTVISSDRLVFCDFKNYSIKLVDTNKNLVCSNIRLPSAPWDSSILPPVNTGEPTSRELIVTMPYDRQLRYIRVTGNQIKDTRKVMAVDGFCCGIQVLGNRTLAISYIFPEKVEIRDLDGKILRTLHTDPSGYPLFCDPEYLAASPDSSMLYVSDCRNNTLTSIRTRDWSVLSRLEGLALPRGVTVDKEGRVFVACLRDSTVHHVSATGDRSTRILGKEDGLCEDPWIIEISPEEDRMYISDIFKNHVQEFRLTGSHN